MEGYYFLFAIGLIWIVFATIQDIRKREIANWLNFSLIGFASAYRAFYSSLNSEWGFFLYGIIGFGFFFAFANLFYYTKVFAGGDAKLLMGLGIVLPIERLIDFVYLGIGFISVLFIIGALYGILYSFFIVYRNWRQFRKEFRLIFKKDKWLFNLVVLFIIFELFVFVYGTGRYSFLIAAIVIPLFLPILYFYLKSVEKCMIVLREARDLREGDWLEKEIWVGNRMIKKSVHGLSSEEIRILRKAKKRALIKEGIPFAPAFLVSFIFMVFFFLGGLNLERFLASLF